MENTTLALATARPRGRPKGRKNRPLTQIIFDCLRWGPRRPRDILIAAGYESQARYDVVCTTLRRLEEQGLIYSTRTVLDKTHGGNVAVFYELDYLERKRRYGEAEPWSIAR